MEARHLFRRRHLPHWDVPGATYFVTSCLEGSIPAQGVLENKQYEAALRNRVRPPDRTEDEWALHCWKLLFARAETWLDQGAAVRHLEDPTLARIVVDALFFFAGTRYDLLAFAVMPSHFHWVFRPSDEWAEQLGTSAKTRTPRERIMHSVKRFTADQCNRRLGLRGVFWQQESYDHWARCAEELERIIGYVEMNPVKAGLCARPEDYEFGSAKFRKDRGLSFGSPLRK